MLDEIIDLLSYEPEEILKIVGAIVGILIILGAVYAVFIAPMIPKPAIDTPAVIPTAFPTARPATPTPQQLPANTGYMLVNGDPVYYANPNGTHNQLIGYISKDTPAVYAPFLYGYNEYGDPIVSSNDIPAYVMDNGVFTHQGYYNATLGVFVYYFANTLSAVVVVPTVEPNQSIDRSTGNYALTGEYVTIDGIVYAKDSNGYWVQLTNNTLQPVAIYNTVKYPDRAGDVNINWGR